MTEHQPEAPAEDEYEAGEIYVDARGFRYLRVLAGPLPRLPASGTPLPWMFLDSSGDAVGRLEGIPQRPLRKMVPAGSPQEPARPPLTPAECDRLRAMTARWENAAQAVRKGLEMTAALDDADRAVIAAAWAGLKVLEGSEKGSQP